MIELCACARVSVFNACLCVCVNVCVCVCVHCSALLVGLWHRFHSPAGAAFDKIIRRTWRGLQLLQTRVHILNLITTRRTTNDTKSK